MERVHIFLVNVIENGFTSFFNLLSLCIVLLSAGCNETILTGQTYIFHTPTLTSEIYLETDSKFTQIVSDKNNNVLKKIEGKWRVENRAICFSRLFYLIDATDLHFLEQPKLMYLVRFQYSHNILYVKDQPQIYRTRNNKALNSPANQ